MIGDLKLDHYITVRVPMCPRTHEYYRLTSDSESIQGFRNGTSRCQEELLRIAIVNNCYVVVFTFGQFLYNSIY